MTNQVYTIIEDCSPYYIRFTFDGLSNIIKYAGSQTASDIKQYKGYSHDTLSYSSSNTIISMLPMSKEIDFNVKRVAVFTTVPGGGCGIHKDGINHRMSLNIPLEILDSQCITNWYTDAELKDTQLVGDTVYSRNVHLDYTTMNKFAPVKTMVAKPDEMLLFNTDIYHSWDNTNSGNKRKILTLRATAPESVFFDDVRKILIG
jgi:hypothetical protein